MTKFEILPEENLASLVFTLLASRNWPLALFRIYSTISNTDMTIPNRMILLLYKDLLNENSLQPKLSYKFFT